MNDSHDIHVGVLAMQGAFARHVAVLQERGVRASEVRTPAELAAVDALVIPGGESTAIRKALDRGELLEPLRERLASGMPAFGTCAGLIVLAHAAEDGAPETYGALDVDVARNGFGRQVHSFEGSVDMSGGDLGDLDGGRLSGVFIRAPRITRLGDDVTVLGRLAGGEHDGEPVVVRQGNLLGATFHPELTDDPALHARFVELVRAALAAPATTSAP
ncbi:MAG: glutamine amidotransferase [Thermoleophilia bacterium]|nr:glutamine amidotransferase [Thermoleophilia bacterium]MCZ4496465.1 glutamine amidotransferase [Thermoleophilia bacterium]